MQETTPGTANQSRPLRKPPGKVKNALNEAIVRVKIFLYRVSACSPAASRGYRWLPRRTVASSPPGRHSSLRSQAHQGVGQTGAAQRLRLTLKGGPARPSSLPSVPVAEPETESARSLLPAADRSDLFLV